VLCASVELSQESSFSIFSGSIDVPPEVKLTRFSGNRRLTRSVEYNNGLSVLWNCRETPTVSSVCSSLDNDFFAEVHRPHRGPTEDDATR
jgi:hypothetical protein